MKYLCTGHFRFITLGILLILIINQAPFGLNSVGQSRPEPATKLYEYGPLIWEDESAPLDDFSVRLRSEPTARGCIVIYPGSEDPPGAAHRIGLRTKEYLVRSQGFPSDRIIILIGGRREAITTQLWVVPMGGQLPVLNPLFKEDDRNKKIPWKYDEFTYNYEESWFNFELPRIRLGGYVDALRSNPGSRGFIVAYALAADHQNGIVRDPSGSARQFARRERSYLIRTEQVSPERIISVDGGYKTLRIVTLWIVPPGSSPPKFRK